MENNNIGTNESQEENFLSMGETRRVARERKRLIDQLKAENAELRKQLEQTKTSDHEETDGWASREVKRFIERERRGAEEKGESTMFHYVEMCAESALKAYCSLMEDGPSNNSIGITKGILNLLIDHKPLTPISGDDDEWVEVWKDYKEHKTTYQNNRYSALFKDVYDDGLIEYHDNDRFVCVNKNNPHDRFYSGFITRKVVETGRKIAKITFPYIPLEKSVEIFVEELLTDYANGDYDTIHIDRLSYNEPETGTHVGDEIGRYFKCYGTGGMVEIDCEEWLERKCIAQKLKEKFDKVYDEVKAEHPEYKEGEVYRVTMNILNPQKPETDNLEDCVPGGGGGD